MVPDPKGGVLRIVADDLAEDVAFTGGAAKGATA